MGRFSKGTNTVGRSYIKQDPVTGGIRLPRGTTGERPTDNTTGTLRFNSTDNRVEYYDGSNFKQFRDYDDGELVVDSNITINDNFISTTTSNSNLILDPAGTGMVEMIGTGATIMPIGTTAQRPSGSAGMIRYNSTTSALEFHNGSSFQQVSVDSDASSADTSNTAVISKTQMTTNIVTVDDFETSTFWGARYEYVVFDEISGEFETGTIHLIHNSGDCFINNYGVTHTGSSPLGTFTSDIEGGKARLRFTGTSNTSSFSAFRTAMGDSSEADSSSDNTGLTLVSDLDSAQAALDTTSASTYRGVQYLIMAYNAGDDSTSGFEIVTINCVHDGSTAYHTEYGRLTTAHAGHDSTQTDIASYDVDINGGNIRLLGTSFAANTVIKIYKKMIKDSETALSGTNVDIITNTDVDSAIENINTFENSKDQDTTFQMAHYLNTVKAPAGVGGAEYQISDIYVVGDGVGDTVVHSEFGIVTTGSRQLITYTTDYDNTTIRLRGVGATTNLVVNGYRIGVKRTGGGVSADAVVTKSGADTITGVKTFTQALSLTVGSDPGTVANNAHIYSKDVTSSAEVFVRDEAGNVTKISPHNEQGEWEYYSRNVNTGKTVRVNMEQMIKDIEQLTGKKYIESD
mgnify:FL=1